MKDFTERFWILTYTRYCSKSLQVNNISHIRDELSRNWDELMKNDWISNQQFIIWFIQLDDDVKRNASCYLIFIHLIGAIGHKRYLMNFVFLFHLWFCSTFPMGAHNYINSSINTPFFWITNVKYILSKMERWKKEEWITYHQVSGFVSHRCRTASHRWSSLWILLSSFWRVCAVYFPFYVRWCVCMRAMRGIRFLLIDLIITEFCFYHNVFLDDWNVRVSFRTRVSFCTSIFFLLEISSCRAFQSINLARLQCLLFSVLYFVNGNDWVRLSCCQDIFNLNSNFSRSLILSTFVFLLWLHTVMLKKMERYAIDLDIQTMNKLLQLILENRTFWASVQK